MPRLIYPLQAGSLVSVEETDAPAPRAAKVLTVADGVSAEAAKLGASLLRIASEAPNNFIGIRAPGCWGDSDLRFCPSSVEIPGAKTEVYVQRNGSATVQIELRYKVPKAEAQAIYDGFVKNLKALWPTKEMREKTWPRSGLPYLEMQLTDRADFLLDLRGSDDKYNVTATIAPVN